MLNNSFKYIKNYYSISTTTYKSKILDEYYLSIIEECILLKDYSRFKVYYSSTLKEVLVDFFKLYLQYF